MPRPTSSPKRRPKSEKPAPQASAADRVAKVIARAGVASRREAEAMIADGRVAVNGTVLTSPALNVLPSDVITVDGAPLAAPEMTRLWLYHKPDGLVTTHKDPQGRPTVFEALPEGMPRVISVGRLDLTSEGLLLLTNDGALARTLELPATGLERTYRARAFGRVTQGALDQLAEGITVDGVDYGPIIANLEKGDGSNVWIEVKLTEGRNREVRKVLAALDLKVNRLIRTHYGPFRLTDLAPGALDEIPSKDLKRVLGKLMPKQAAGAVPPKPLPAPVSEEPLKQKKAKRLTGGRGGPRMMMDVLAEEDLIRAERQGRAPSGRQPAGKQMIRGRSSKPGPKPGEQSAQKPGQKPGRKPVRAPAKANSPLRPQTAGRDAAKGGAGSAGRPPRPGQNRARNSTKPPTTRK